MKKLFIVALISFAPFCIFAQVNNSADSLKHIADSIAAKKITDSLLQKAKEDAKALKLLNDSISKNEFSISYDINILPEKTNTIAETYNGAVKTVYVKGKRAKLKFVSLMRVQTIYYKYKSANKNNVATIVKESGKEKYKFTLSEQRWKVFNKRYDSLKYTFALGDSTYILGRLCRKAQLEVSPESSLTVYYLPGVKNPVLTSAEPLFASLPGIPLMYEFQKGNNKITYTASEINFLPIDETYFKEPTKGYTLKKFKPGSKIEKLVLDGDEKDDDGPEEEEKK